MRIATALCTLILASTFSLVACGGGGDDDGGADDTGDTGDNMGDDDQEPMPDAMPEPEGKTFGQACTPSATDPMGQGDCGTGLVCLAGLTGSTGPYCTKTCDGEAQNPTAECEPLLNGPGLGGCFLGVDFNDDNMADAFFCTIVCQADNAQICPDCNNTCPDNYLMCTGELTDMNGAVVAHACN
jgi:hypothetical protein